MSIKNTIRDVDDKGVSIFQEVINVKAIMFKGQRSITGPFFRNIILPIKII